MTIQLPAPIAGYYDADRAGDPNAVAAWFREDAAVTDEGHQHRGRDAIRAWKAEASQAYSYTVEPFAMVHEGGRAIVTARVSGDFPGSPVDLQYLFALYDEKIAALEIVS